MLEDGERHPLFEGTKVRVDFRHEARGDIVAWRAECNYFGADVDVTERRLVIGETVQTDMGCFKPQMRQDRWMARFFGADPKWRIRHEEKLRLTAGDRVIRLTSRRRDR